MRKANYLHVGIPMAEKSPNMIYDERFKVWYTEPEEYDFLIEYLKYEEDTLFPKILQEHVHLCYEVEDMQQYLDQAEQVIFEPHELDEKSMFAYILMDGTIFELQAPKNGLW